MVPCGNLKVAALARHDLVVSHSAWQRIMASLHSAPPHQPM